MPDEFSVFLSKLVRGASILLDTRAKLYTDSTRIRDNIKTVYKQNGKSRYTIRSVAKGTTSVPGLARYREFGTMEHPIVPRNASALVFPWDKANDSIPRTPDGRVILRKVNHPGSKAANNGKGYMRPAGRDAIKYLKENAFVEGKLAIKADIVASFKTR